MIKTLLTLFFWFGFLAQGKAQSEAPHHYSKAIFVEALGNGMGISANYDMRIKRGVQDGFGFRVGIGGFNITGIDENGRPAQASMLTFPLVANYLIGKRRSAFEAGLGLTPLYLTASLDDPNIPDKNSKGWGTSGFINLGYRLQPLRNGFVFRLNWTPGFNSTGFYPAWFGISAGLGFK